MFGLCRLSSEAFARGEATNLYFATFGITSAIWCAGFYVFLNFFWGFFGCLWDKWSKYLPICIYISINASLSCESLYLVGSAVYRNLGIRILLF